MNMFFQNLKVIQKMANICRKIILLIVFALFLLNMNALFRYASEDSTIRAEVHQLFNNHSKFTFGAIDDPVQEGLVAKYSGRTSNARGHSYTVLEEKRNVKVNVKVKAPRPIMKVTKSFDFESNLVEVDPLRFRPTNESTLECQIQYPANDKLKFNNAHWQVLETKTWTYYIYSAFYDKRELTGQNPVIRILGIGNSLHIGSRTTNNFLFCQLWFSELPKAKVVKVSSARSLWAWKKTVQKGAHVPHMLTCLLQPSLMGLIPFAVSIVTKKCEQALNKLKVIHSSPPPQDQNSPDGFGVCVKGLDFPDRDISLRLVEWIELIRLLGASKIQMYLYAVHPNTKKVLDYYIQKGVVELGPLTLPGPFSNDPHFRHQYFLKQVLRKRQLEILPYNDCLYRNMYRHKYLTLLDIDEVIVPLTVKTWTELLNTHKNSSFKENESKRVSSYQVRQNGCFFEGVKRPWFDKIPQKMHMLQHVFKIPREGGQFGTGTKGFILPNHVLVLFNHWPTACLNRRCHMVKLNETLVQLQHYKHVQRHCGLRKGTHMYKCQDLKCLNYTVDRTLWKYKDDLIPNFIQSISNIFQDQPPTQWDGKDNF